MTGREKLRNVLNKKAVDRISWTTLVDDTTRTDMADDIRKLHPFDFYRSIGCDIMQFGDYGFYGTDNAVGSPAQLVTPEITVRKKVNADGLEEIIKTSMWGTLTAWSKNGHLFKHPVESIEELRILKNIWLNSHYEEDITDHFEKGIARTQEKIGDSGIYVHTLGPSPVQQLLEFDMGVLNFNYLITDHQDEMVELLNVMHECRKQEYEILARRTFVQCVIPVENTSTAMISPQQYERFSLSQISDFVEVMHKHNKKAVLHMCGHLKRLLPIIKETGLDGINGLTPPPVGDTTVNDVLDVFGEDFIILGGVFDPSVFQRQQVSKEEIWEALDEIYTPRLRQANFVLWASADGIPTPLERFFAIRDWFKETDKQL